MYPKKLTCLGLRPICSIVQPTNEPQPKLAKATSAKALITMTEKGKGSIRDIMYKAVCGFNF